jgi:hypothetical protein
MTDEQKERITDITRLVGAEADQRTFVSMLESKLRSHQELPDHGLRRVAEDLWREFLRNGWGPKIYGPEDTA